MDNGYFIKKEFTQCTVYMSIDEKYKIEKHYDNSCSIHLLDRKSKNNCTERCKTIEKALARVPDRENSIWELAITTRRFGMSVFGISYNYKNYRAKMLPNNDKNSIVVYRQNTVERHYYRDTLIGDFISLGEAEDYVLKLEEEETMKTYDNLVMVADTDSYVKYMIPGKEEYRICKVKAKKDTFIIYKVSSIPQCYNKITTRNTLDECIEFINNEFKSAVVLINDSEWVRDNECFHAVQDDFRIEKNREDLWRLYTVVQRGSNVKNYNALPFRFEDIEEAVKVAEFIRTVKYTQEV